MSKLFTEKGEPYVVTGAKPGRKPSIRITVPNHRDGDGLFKQLDEQGYVDIKAYSAPGYEVLYSTGGHSGPFNTVDAAWQHAARSIRGNKNEDWVKIIPYTNLVGDPGYYEEARRMAHFAGTNERIVERWHIMGEE